MKKYSLLLLVQLIGILVMSQNLNVRLAVGEVYSVEDAGEKRVKIGDYIDGKTILLKNDNSFIVWNKEGEEFIIEGKQTFIPDTVAKRVTSTPKQEEGIWDMVWNALFEKHEINNAELGGLGLGTGASVSRGGEVEPMFYNGNELNLVPNADFLLVWPKFDQENYKVTFYDIKLEKSILDTLVSDTIFLADFETIKNCQYCEVSIDVEDFVYANMYFEQPADSVLDTQAQLNALLTEGEGYNYLLAMYYNDLKYHHNMLAYFYKTMLAFPEKKQFQENWNSFFK